MFTSGERRGLILLLILLVLLVVFVICRRTLLFATSSSVGNDKASSMIISDSVPRIPINTDDSLCKAKKKSERKRKSTNAKSIKRTYSTRNPLSEPVN